MPYGMESPSSDSTVPVVRRKERKRASCSTKCCAAEIPERGDRQADPIRPKSILLEGAISGLTYEEFNELFGLFPTTTYVMQWGGSHVWKPGGKVFVIGGVTRA